MRKTIYVIIALTIGFLYFRLHKGGRWNPHLVTVSEEQLAEKATVDWRYCTFTSAAPLEVSKRDYVKFLLPGGKEELKQFPKAASIEHIYLKCRASEVDTTNAAAMNEDQKLLELCVEGDEVCDNLEPKEPGPFLNKFLKKE